MIFGKERVTTGASNDIERATELARNMVTRWGLSEKLGPIVYGEDEGEVFLGRSVTKRKEVSEATAEEIDREIRKIIDTNYFRAEEILRNNLDKLHKMSEALMKYETIDEQQIKQIMAGEEPKPPKGWGENDDSDSGTKKETTIKPSDDDEVGHPANEH